MQLESAKCSNCNMDDCTPIAVGKDFEYETTDEEFLAVQCRRCSVVYLNPRPCGESLAAVYPDNYHAFHCDYASFGFVYSVRQRLEAKRLLRWCSFLPDQAKILDVGCGDGFHLELLKRFGKPNWTVEGVDSDVRVLKGAEHRGLTDCIHVGQLAALNLAANSYDMILLIMTIEHLSDPAAMLEEVRRLLRVGGRLVIVTDNTGSPDFSIFKNRHWGGYHFPRHLYLFNRSNLSSLCQGCGYNVVSVRTAVSPVNWTYSLRNWIQDWGGPNWVRNQFSLKSPIALGLFTLLDTPLSWIGLGAILHGVFEKNDTNQ